MPYFSRLTDIITCRISDLLATAPDPRQALSEILTEMREGLSACDRNLQTYASSRDRLKSTATRLSPFGGGTKPANTSRPATRMLRGWHCSASPNWRT
jgi:hypothetical protein